MLDALIQYLSQNVGLVYGSDLFKNFYPDDPDKIVSIIDRGGFRPSLYDSTREKIIEVKIRSKEYEVGQSLGEQIMSLFHSKENYLIDNINVYQSYALTDVSYLYADSKERDEFSFELAFLIHK